MAVTIKDIAEELGCSFSTVSYVLRNHRNTAKVGAELRQKILDAAEKYHYQPNIMARGMRAGKTFLVAVIRDESTPYVNDVANTIGDLLEDEGYNIVLVSVKGAEDCQKKVSFLMQRHIDGLIIMNHMTEKYQDVYRPLVGKLPMVCMTHESGIEGIPSVYVDETAIGTIGANYLLENGHRKILLLGKRCQCIRRATELIADQGGTAIHWQERDKAIERLLQEKLDVSVIWAYNDKDAMRIVTEALWRHVSVPEQLSVLGINNDMDYVLVRPYISTIEVPRYAQAKSATYKLLAMLKGQDSGGDDIMQPSLVARDSVRNLSH